MFSKVSRYVYNIWLANLIRLSCILIIYMMAQISPDLHGVGLKLKTTQPIIVYNFIKALIMLELLSEDGMFQ